ncbi:LexA family transcriptional regulator [Pseudoalteromonas sp. NSLLW218]|uniref:LexA family protein n=1 Tax=Pseudoalteromonas sp. NSLLW218 TaxID=2792048 RepID=UPI0018CE94C1|nr:LexA family transcriptional regulator [Pseudoalteromonas sp. NSLLW218]MBH0088624.1 helix-turn-helix domain-containing protein [Pseudoalteromonas sp. NSLLW218]
MNTLAKRLGYVLEIRNITQEKVASAIGTSQQSIHAICSGKTLKPRNLVAIARFLNVSADWLESGGGNMDLAENNAVGVTQFCSSVPLISWVQAGHWADIHLNDIDEFYPCPEKHSKATYSLKVKGESMSPDFINGEIIFVDPEVEARNGSCVVIRQNGNTEATFKQLIIDGSQKYLKALNPNWPNPIIEMLPDAVICGVVIGSYRKRN